MKKMIFTVLVVAVALVGCAGSRAVQYGTIGAATGTGLGYAIAKGPGALVGGLLGGAAGATIGTIKDERGPIVNGPTPLPWIRGERVIVATQGWSWGDSVRAIIEDELRGRGAVIVAIPGRGWGYSAQEGLGAAYVAEVYSDRQGDYAIVQIRVIDRTNNTVRAMSTGRSEIYNAFYYGSGGDYRSFEIAARRALANLH